MTYYVNRGIDFDRLLHAIKSQFHGALAAAVVPRVSHLVTGVVPQGTELALDAAHDADELVL